MLWDKIFLLEKNLRVKDLHCYCEFHYWHHNNNVDMKRINHLLEMRKPHDDNVLVNVEPRDRDHNLDFAAKYLLFCHQKIPH